MSAVRSIWRTDRKFGRLLCLQRPGVDEGRSIGLMDTPELASLAAFAVNLHNGVFPILPEGGTRPPDRRPIQPPEETGETRTTYTTDTTQRWAHVGWLGASGRLYSLFEQPGDFEPISYEPLWVLVDETPQER